MNTNTSSQLISPNTSSLEGNFFPKEIFYEKITKFDNPSDADSLNTHELPLGLMLEEILECKYHKPVSLIREHLEQGRVSNAETILKQLPKFTVSAIHSTHSVGISHNIIEHTGYLHCHFAPKDNPQLKNLPRIREKVQSDYRIVACFLGASPQELEVLVRIPANTLRHEESFEVVFNYFRKKYDLNMDEQYKDILAPCSISADPFLYYNPFARAFKLPKQTLCPPKEARIFRTPKRARKQYRRKQTLPLPQSTICHWTAAELSNDEAIYVNND